ncbi:MAG: cytochrome c [Bryobacteraceae bacterium]|nr:cytochrome c [Bryobacteraceae bacterium]
MLVRSILLAGASAMAVFAADASKNVTFHKDVQPILQKHCQECHRPGEIGPMPLLNYKQARPWAKSMKQQVLAKKMPPWPIDRSVGKFANDRSLTNAEVETLVAWVDGGAKEGNPKDAPKPLEWISGWNIGKPDMEVEMPVQIDVPADGKIEYTYIVVPTNFTEDKWVQAVEVRPGNRSVVHHAVFFIRPPGQKWLAEAKPGEAFVPTVKNDGQRFLNTNGGGNDILTIYTPGMVPDHWADGRAKFVPAGSDLVFQMHYTANGKAAKDRTKLGVIFAKAPVTERVMTLGALNNAFTIPPGDPNYKVEASAPITNEATMISLWPHMHLRGKNFEYDLVNLDGTSTKLFKMDQWDLNWQLNYILAEPIKLKPGMRIHIRGAFDNSPNNPHNPDPKATVRWGEQSWEEMFIGFFDIAVDTSFKDRNDFMRPRQPLPKVPVVKPSGGQ